jgi:HPt (histidine-containing phosphotransfer) domain-containing protein
MTDLVSTSAPTLNTDRLDELAGLEDEGVELVPEIVRMFVADTDKWLIRAGDAVNGANERGLRMIAHNVAGACGRIGAARMQALAGELEAAAALGNLQSAGAIVQMLVEEFRQVRAALGRYAPLAQRIHHAVAGWR